MNIYYIKAAIKARLGISLTYKEILDLLLEEGMITPLQASKALFVSYYKKIEDGVKSEELDDTTKDLTEELS